MWLKLKEKINKIMLSDFVKNIIILISGNILGYGINLIILPIISRIYTQTELGTYDLAISSASFLLTAFQLSLLLVIMIPKDDIDAQAICKIIWITTLAGSILTVSVLILLASYFHLFEFEIPYVYSMGVFGLYLIICNLQSIYYSYVNRKKLYTVLFWNPVIMAIVNGGASVVLGLLKCGATGYFLGTILSCLIAILHMNRYVSPIGGHIKVRYLWDILKKYKAYPLVQLPANFVENMALQLPSQFMGRMFSTAVLSGYTMAGKILSVPVSLLASPVNRVYYRTIVEKLNDDKGNAGEFAFGLLKNNIKSAIIPIGMLMVFGDIITKTFLGEQWEISGTYILIMGMMYLLKYCSSCMSGTLVAVGKHKIRIGYAFFSIFVHVICFLIADIMGLNVIQTIVLYTIFASFSTVVNLMLDMHCLKYPTFRFLMFLSKYILGGSIVIYGIYIMRRLIENLIL